MRTYIIGNDGIALCRKTPAKVSDGEIVIASKEELHAAPLNGKRLLALWNALPGVEKRRKVGDREALIDQLWPAIEPIDEFGNCAFDLGQARLSCWLVVVAAAPGSGRRPARVLASRGVVDARPAVCLAPVASHRTAPGSQS